MFWTSDWAWGLPVLVSTVVAHVCAFVMIGLAVMRVAPRPSGRRRPGRFILAVALTALFAATLHGLEAALWAAVFVGLGALPDVHDAMLYSLGAITSYGHVGIYLGNGQMMEASSAARAFSGSFSFFMRPARPRQAAQVFMPI